MLISLLTSRWCRLISVTLASCFAILMFVPDDAMAVTDESPFQPGRAIQVTIWQEPDLSGSYSIDSNGYVILPLIGRVQVSRFTKDSLEGYLVDEYSNYLRSPIIMVEPLIRIGVVGEVRSPGLYRVNPDSPLWDVIGLSGGFTSRANISKIRIMRSGEVVNEHLLPAFESGESLYTIGIQSGDQVFVPQGRRVMEWRTVIAFMSLGISATWLIIRSSKN